jgi:uroporphyrinogen decarboxylase
MGGLARLHICGDTTRILEDMVVTEADIIDIDWMVDMATAGRAFGGGPAVCGNFDPVQVMLEGTPQQVYEATQRCIAAGGERSISAAGCEIPRGTPPENLHAQSRALEEMGSESDSLLPW